MELQSNQNRKKSVAMFIRMDPEMVEACQKLAEKAGVGVSTLMRQIIEGALEEGVEIVGAGKKERREK